MLTYFSWWYGQELAAIWQATGVMTAKVYSLFSISLLLQTLFDPWKRDIVAAENVSLDVRIRLLVENLTSRFIGFIIRLMTIAVGLLVTIISFGLLIAFLLIWLLLPIIIILLIFNGLRVIING